MNIVKLTSEHQSLIRPLFNKNKHAGVSAKVMTEHTTQWRGSMDYDQWAHESFCNTFLSGLTAFHAFGVEDNNGNIVAATSFFESDRDPSWYYLTCRNNGDRTMPSLLLESIADYNERNGRLKFFTVFNSKHGPAIRRLWFTKRMNERYGHYDELVVPPQTRCFYNTYWEVLYARALMPVETTVRCTYLKPEYRNTLPVGGSI